MKLLKMIRAVEWWEYKFPPILMGAYLILTVISPPLLPALQTLFFILLSLITGAVYVSILNDITDVKEDALAGKNNRMAAYSKSVQLLFVFTILLIALFFCNYIQTDTLSLTLYILCYIAFTLYSLPPFRLKKRGLAGIFADASGSQLFPTLYAATVISTHLNYHLKTTEIAGLSAWSLCFGLRGILWHQFHDLDNDVKSGLTTWVQNLNKGQIKIIGSLLISIELCAFLFLLLNFGLYSCFFSLLVYLAYLWWKYKKNDVEIIILKYAKPNYSIFMNEYYQVFFPLTVLSILSLHNSQFVYLLMLHVLIFPSGIIRIFKSI